MTIDTAGTDKKRIPESFVQFMRLNAAHGELAIPELRSKGAHDSLAAASANHACLLEELTPVYRRFATALNTYVYQQNARDIPPPLDEYELLCYCMVSADNLAEGIKRAMKFVSALNGRGGTLSLSTNGEKAVLSCEVGWTHRSLSALSLDMLSLTFYCKLFSWLIDEPLADLELTFSHRPLLDAVYLDDLLPCKSHYDGAQTTIAFTKQLLERPIVKTQRQLTRMLAGGPLEFLPTSVSGGVSQRVKNLLGRALAEQRRLPALDCVAQQLGKSSSTLRRRLTMEGVSFQALLIECRKSRALELLASTQMPIDEIAWLVGFSERSAFSHAFKSWTESTPSAYRESVYQQAHNTSSAA